MPTSMWEEVKEKIVSLNLSVNEKISQKELLQKIDILSRFISEQQLKKAEDTSGLRIIKFCIDQITSLEKHTRLVPVAIIYTIGNAFEDISLLPGSKKLLPNIEKHLSSSGLFEQTIITWILSKYISVTGVEQEKGRVDFSALICNRKVNFHVKSIDPRTKQRNLDEAYINLYISMIQKPARKNNKILALVLFNGYVRNGLTKEFWSNEWKKILQNPRESVVLEIPGSNKHEASSRIEIGFKWVKSRHGVTGKSGGINAFQNAMPRIIEISNSIPKESKDIEFAILISGLPGRLNVGNNVLISQRLDGIMAVSVSPGQHGFFFKRSKVFVKPKFQIIKAVMEKSIPESVWRMS